MVVVYIASAFVSFLTVAHVANDVSSFILAHSNTIRTRAAFETIVYSSEPKITTTGELLNKEEDLILPEDLLEMDVFTFVRKSKTAPLLELGAILDGSVIPLCTWTTEPDHGGSIEFLQNDQDELLQGCTICSLLPADALSFGSRQVGGGKGPGNPHGEESELLYYVKKRIIDQWGIHVVVRPELEILW
mmetsp:Transcript_13643/g.19550  ORF Transcript_13643/g.19550 Transcript_13643/m.19550 type:complete len:189 (-) Transcript_13643:134-700(-)|eukprot:CAMPEP_0172426270 /NCGR_PEP_ID=MMETSP1064-20121228/36602_1 /TAXON_ID=202472 /ORGANISM="Aulacoseira subarctica , Strain CCAP 1002/5" /LENGTH=188 /DNA_ID=CAMNT_0013169747 /DNA_START=183 /DNA_END=749 /DNA_ORIENTATION=+